MSDIWVKHDGKGCPVKENVKCFIKFRDGTCLSFAALAIDWNARWYWHGARSKKENDVIEYMVSK